jgi:hypothetical protein
MALGFNKITAVGMAVGLMIALQSCASSQQQQASQQAPQQAQEVLYQPVAGANVKTADYRKLTFRRNGDEYTIRAGEPVVLSFENVDLNRSSFMISEEPETQTVTFKLARRDEVIRLHSKCQVYRISVGEQYYPRVEVADELRGKEQVIITPILGDDCNVIGYQVRLGAIERGCNDRETLKLLENLKRCREQAQGSRTQRPSAAVKFSRDCLEYRLFGIRCP